MINKIKNFFLRLCSFFYSKSNKSEYEKRYSNIGFKSESLHIVDSVQEKSNNENIVSDNPVELKRDVLVISNKTGIGDFEKSNKLGKQCKKKKKF